MTTRSSSASRNVAQPIQSNAECKGPRVGARLFLRPFIGAGARRSLVSRSVTEWWGDAVVYQVYPRSFADTNNDGIGDLAGIAAHLDHLAWLGVDGLWISAVNASPNADWG